MTRTFLAASLLALGATAAFAQSGTVNSYTQAQAAKATAAVRAAGYTPGTIAAAQAGNLFVNAKKGGGSYMATVTADGHVYASPSVIAAPTVPAAPAR